MSSLIRHIDYQDVKALRNGDLHAFDNLFEKYSDRLYNFSLKYLKSAEDAEEVVQEVFLYIWEKREGLKPDSSFNSYVFTIAYNIIKKHFIKISRQNAYLDSQIHTFLSTENKLDQVIDYKLMLEKVELVIQSMPARRKEIFIKRKYLDQPIKDIAKELNISPNTVENHLTAAQKQIQSELGKNGIAGLLYFSLFFPSSL